MGHRTATATLIAALGVTALIGACDPAPSAPGPGPAPVTNAPASTAPTTTIAPGTAPTTTAPTSGVPSPSILPPLSGNPTLVVNEEFTNDTAWRAMFKPYQNSYMESNGIQNYWLTRNVTQHSAEGGFLRLSAHRESYTVGSKTYNYTSGIVGTRDNGNYYTALGRYAVAARLPHSSAEWSAIWLRHRNGSSQLEVDIVDQFEAEDGAGTIRHAIHKPSASKGAGSNLLSKATYVENPFQTAQWHVYSVDIIKVSSTVVDFVFRVDGVQTAVYRDKYADTWLTLAPIDQAFDICIDHKVGGKWTGDPSRPYDGTLMNGSKAKAPVGSIPNPSFPSNVDVAWVKVWKA